MKFQWKVLQIQTWPDAPWRRGCQWAPQKRRRQPCSPGAGRAPPHARGSSGHCNVTIKEMHAHCPRCWCSLTAVVLAFTSRVVLRGPGIGKRQRRAAGFTVRQQVKIHNQALETSTQRHTHTLDFILWPKSSSPFNVLNAADVGWFNEFNSCWYQSYKIASPHNYSPFQIVL